MAITQKLIKEHIENTEKMIKDTVEESDDMLTVIRKYRDDSGNINPQRDTDLIEKIDEYNGLQQTLNYYTGHLNALELVLKEMKTKNKKK